MMIRGDDKDDDDKESPLRIVLQFLEEENENTDGSNDNTGGGDWN